MICTSFDGGYTYNLNNVFLALMQPVDSNFVQMWSIFFFGTDSYSYVQVFWQNYHTTRSCNLWNHQPDELNLPTTKRTEAKEQKITSCLHPLSVEGKLNVNTMRSCPAQKPLLFTKP
jgi:hypothetical protein